MGSGIAHQPGAPRRAAALTAFLDTNVLIRHLTGDPPEMAARATAALASADQLMLADVVVAECVYMLESFYEVERQKVAELMRAAKSNRSTAPPCCGRWRCTRSTGWTSPRLIWLPRRRAPASARS